MVLNNGVDDVNTVKPHFPDPNVFISHQNDDTDVNIRHANILTSSLVTARLSHI